MIYIDDSEPEGGKSTNCCKNRKNSDSSQRCVCVLCITGDKGVVYLYRNTALINVIIVFPLPKIKSITLSIAFLWKSPKAKLQIDKSNQHKSMAYQLFSTLFFSLLAIEVISS